MRFGLLPHPASQTLLLSLLMAAAAGHAMGQDYFPSSSEEPPAPTRSFTPGSQVTSRAPSDDSPFRVGPIVIKPHASYRYDYGDGVRARPGVTEKTSLQRLILGSIFELGELWQFDYAATWNYYSSDAFRDTLDHNASLSGALEFRNWQIQVAQSFAKTAPSLIETGRQTGLETHTTNISFARPVSDRLSMHLGLNQDLRYSDSLSDVFEWSGTPGLTYAWTPYFSTNANLSVGHVVVTSAPDVIFYRPQVGFSAVLTEKLMLNGFAGSDRRQFMTGPAEDMSTPMYGADLQYTPFTQTQISIGVSQQASTSYLGGSTTESQQWNINFRQRLFGRVTLTAGYTESQAGFTAPVAGLPVIREDDRESFQVALQTGLFERGSVSVSYRETKNDSSASGFGVDSSVIGFQFSYRY